MAFDDKTRGRLQKLVTECRGLLTDEFRIQVQQTYGLDPNTGEVTPLDRLTHLSAAERETADLLRQTLAHYVASEGLADSADHRAPIIDRIVREQAFTVLNRLAALLMMEARGVLLPAVSQGQQSKAFELYKVVAGSALGETGQAYQAFLFSLFDEFARELPALFDRFAPQGRLFPREAAFLQVLAALNHHEVQPVWPQDETIGWIYQYFNDPAERKRMRDPKQGGSLTPRNSRELAVRNQFFTPRYVVEFLVDNTLGRLWFNATGGKTRLREHCQYLMVNPDERPPASLRPRDPRTLKLLDPACGSMHFGLYAFDLFLAIYQEAWEWEQTHGPGSLDVSIQPLASLLPLCQTYADKAAYLRDIPRLVIERNIYGVDIDPRAAQIASLALWLRAQRAWHDESVKAQDRPTVRRGHVIAATAPPAEKELREQFAARLDGQDAELFAKTLQLLKGAPELGMLLRVERELPRLVRSIHGEHGSLFRDVDADQWRKAEARLRTALTEFSGAIRVTYQGRLFAEDVLQGLRLIDICSEIFDVVVMNPPFGSASKALSKDLTEWYPDAYVDLYACFVCRAVEICHGWVGVISSRSLLISKKLERLRKHWVVPRMETLLDLGWPVMDDATVQSAAYVLNCTAAGPSATIDSIDRKPNANKELGLVAIVSSGSNIEGRYKTARSIIEAMPRARILYNLPPRVSELLTQSRQIGGNIISAKLGMKSFRDFRFLRARHEVSPDKIGRGKQWVALAKGGPHAFFYSELPLLVNWNDDGREICEVNRQVNGQTAQARQASVHYYKRGGTYSRRSKDFGVRVLPEDFIIGEKGPAILPIDCSPAFAIGLLNARLYRTILNLLANAKQYDSGLVESLPLVNINQEQCQEIERVTNEAVLGLRRRAQRIESDPLFVCPEISSTISTAAEQLNGDSATLEGQISHALNSINRIVDSGCGIDSEALERLVQLEKVGGEDSDEDADDEEDEADDSAAEAAPVGAHKTIACDLFSYLFGCAIGRWDVRFATGERQAPDLNDHFESLPSNPPGLLEQPGALDILVDDELNDFDVLRRVRECGRSIWKDRADDIEHEMASALGEASIRDYLRSTKGFFSDHLSRYTKGKRKAPLYWPLSTTSGGYTLWVYYPSLTRQTLYTAINDFVEPKLTQVDEDVSALRNKEGARTRDDEKQFEALQTLAQELSDLRDTLRGLAQNYQPNHDDGVQITAAPLWPLFRHRPWQKLLKDTFAKLQKGDYDWAHLAMTYWPDRVHEKCKTDKSFAIAHGLEQLYVEPEVVPKKSRGRKKADT